MKNKILYLAFSLIFLNLFFSCKKKSDPTPVVEVELFTTVKLIFTPTTGGTPLTFVWKDPDGATGSATPTVQNITLKKNTSYDLEIELLDETKNPAKDMTEEVEEKDTEHQLFFLRTGTGFASFLYADVDGNNKPIGLSNTIVTTSTSGNNLGTLKVVLRHEPNKNASGVSTGDITNAGGETDIETTPVFNVSLID